MVKESKKSAKIQAVFKIAGRIYKAEGKTVLEAIQNLKPETKRGIGVLNIEKNIIRDGVPMRDKILNRFKVNRIFNSVGLTRDVAIHQASQLFE